MSAPHNEWTALKFAAFKYTMESWLFGTQFGTQFCREMDRDNCSPMAKTSNLPTPRRNFTNCKKITTFKYKVVISFTSKWRLLWGTDRDQQTVMMRAKLPKASAPRPENLDQPRFYIRSVDGQQIERIWPRRVNKSGRGNSYGYAGAWQRDALNLRVRAAVVQHCIATLLLLALIAESKINSGISNCANISINALFIAVSPNLTPIPFPISHLKGESSWRRQ